MWRLFLFVFLFRCCILVIPHLEVIHLTRMLPGAYSLILVTLFLGACTIADIRNRTVSPPLSLCLICASLLEIPKDYLQSLYGFLIAFLPFFLVVLFGNGGGGRCSHGRCRRLGVRAQAFSVYIFPCFSILCYHTAA